MKMDKKVHSPLFLCIWIVYCVCGLDVSPDETYRLDVIHYNDFHARFEESTMDAIKCKFNNDSCLGGFPRLYYEVKTLFREKPDAILLNAGDSFQGTYWYTLLKWNVTQHFMNLLPHDAHALGNHDFDDGIVGLVPYLATLNAPVVAANIDTNKEFLMYGLCKPHVVVERKGRKIGIIGIITPDTKVLSSSGKVIFTDPIAAAKQEAKDLTDSGVDIIIVLSHCGMDVDKQLARELGHYVDIIVGGHSHRDESVTPPYPVFVESSADQQHQVVIVQAFSFTRFVGNLSVHFDPRGDFVAWDGTLIPLNRSVPEDPEIKSQLAPYAQLVREAEDTGVGRTLRTMPREDCARGECAVADMMLDAFNEYVSEIVKSPYEYLSFVQQSQVRFTMNEGLITRGNIVELLPYFDKLITFELPGRQVLKALERSLVSVSTSPFYAPYMLQVSGLRVTYNASLLEGHRVTSVLLGSENGNDLKQALDPNNYYQVTLPYYIAVGGDGYTMFQKGRRNQMSLGYDQPALEKYLLRHSPVHGKVDGRIKINF